MPFRILYFFCGFVGNCFLKHFARKSRVTYVNCFLALLSSLTERVDDLADGLEEVRAREGPQLILLGPLGDREREGGGAHGRQTQVPGHVLQQRRRRAQRLLQVEGNSKLCQTATLLPCFSISLPSLSVIVKRFAH